MLEPQVLLCDPLRLTMDVVDAVATVAVAAAACGGMGNPSICSSSGASGGAASGVLECLPSRNEKGHGGTPETGTTPARSLSPSSDSGSGALPTASGDVGTPAAAIAEHPEAAMVDSDSAGSVVACVEESTVEARTGIQCVPTEARREALAASDGAVAMKAKTRGPGASVGLGSKEGSAGAASEDGARATAPPPDVIAEAAADSMVLPDAGVTSATAVDALKVAEPSGSGPSRSASETAPGTTPDTKRDAASAVQATVAIDDAVAIETEAATTASRQNNNAGVAGAGLASASTAAVATVGAGPARGSRAKAPSRGGHGGGAERWGSEGNTSQCSGGPAETGQVVDDPPQGSDGNSGQAVTTNTQAANAMLQTSLPASTAASPFALIPPVPALGQTMNSFSDRRIIEVLAAHEQTHRRLLRTARRVPEILSDPGEHALVSCTELYGSLSLDMSEPNALRPWKQDWASYYVNGRSDVDFVVKTRQKVAPSAVAQRLLKKGPWRMVGQVQVHKFASTQFTLLGSFEDEEGGGGEASEVYLDITCIEQTLHFNRFKHRQEAFRKVFMEVRSCIEGQFLAQGALAFDAYIHLLKAFAAKVPGNALTGFQATCIGLFTLQIGHFRMKPTQSIALSLFEGFLRFCFSFYSDIMRPADLCWNNVSYRECAIDLSVGGRWLPRMNSSWHSELYFMAEELKMHTRPDERMNVTHSLDPAKVSVEALALLNRAFFPTPAAGAAARTAQPAPARGRAYESNTDLASPYTNSRPHRDPAPAGRAATSEAGCSTSA